MFLRQSTVQIRTIGPFIDDTDFKTTENGLTIANTDIKLKKNGATAVNKNSGGATSDVNGMYQVTWDATDSNTVGELQWSVLESGVLLAWGTYTVLEEHIYDALFVEGANGFDAAGRVDVASWLSVPVKLGASDNLPQTSPHGWQGVEIPGVTNMIEDDGGGLGRWTAKALEEAPSGSSITDWTSGERDQIRHRLQMDGVQTAPAADSPLQLPIDLQAWQGLVIPGANMIENDAGDGRYTIKALEQGPSGGGSLTEQQVRDAMKLAPSAGVPDVGSVDEHLDDLVEKSDHGIWAVYYSTTNGTPGGTGAFDDPISDEDNTITRMAELNTRILIILDGNFTIPGGNNLDNIDVRGDGLDSEIDLNNQSVSGAKFSSLTIIGQQGGTNEITVVSSVMNGVIAFNGAAFTSYLSGVITVGSKGIVNFDGCQALNAGSPPTIDYQNSSNSVSAVNGYTGPLTVNNIGTNDSVTRIDIQGQLTFASGNTNNTVPVLVSGIGTIIDNSGAGFNFDADEFLSVTNGFAEVSVEAWDGIESAINVGTAGLPDVNAGAIADDATAAVRLADFANEGYDSTSNQVNGVKLVDETTLNSDMRGTDGAATPADVNEQVLDVLTIDTFIDLSGVPPAAPTMLQMLQFGYMFDSYGGQESSDTGFMSVRDGNGAVIGTAPTTDDTVTFTRGKFTTP